MSPTEDYEGKVCGLWNILLHHYYPASEGYIHRAQDKVVQGYLDFNTVRWVQEYRGNAKQEKFFLVTQCKRELREPGQEAWEEGKDQLVRYLGWLEEANKTPAQRFGIVAVGKQCAFYVYRPNTGDKEAAVEAYDARDERTLDLSDPKSARTIHRYLRDIKDTTWM